MPKRISKKRRDANQTAAAVVSLATAEEPKIDSDTLSRVMAAMGRKGGKIGGKRRLETMSPEERRKSASKAAKALWTKRKAG